MEDQNSTEGTFTTIADLLAAIEPGSTLLEAVINMAYGMFGEDFVELVLDVAKIHVHACVLDTNAILNALKYSVTHNSLTALLIAARIGGIRLFASTTV